jgi:hypothetical protein
MINTKNPRHVRSLNALLNYIYGRYYITDYDSVEEVGYDGWTGYVYVVYGGLTLALFEGRTEEDQIHVYEIDPNTGDEIAYDSLEDYYKKVQV